MQESTPASCRIRVCVVRCSLFSLVVDCVYQLEAISALALLLSVGAWSVYRILLERTLVLMWSTIQLST